MTDKQIKLIHELSGEYLDISLMLKNENLEDNTVQVLQIRQEQIIDTLREIL